MDSRTFGIVCTCDKLDKLVMALIDANICILFVCLILCFILKITKTFAEIILVVMGLQQNCQKQKINYKREAVNTLFQVAADQYIYFRYSTSIH